MKTRKAKSVMVENKTEQSGQPLSREEEIAKNFKITRENFFQIDFTNEVNLSNLSLSYKLETARNPDTSPEVLMGFILEAFPHDDIIEAVASNSSTSTETLERLYHKHDYIECLMCLAKNKNTPLYILQRFINRHHYDPILPLVAQKTYDKIVASKLAELRS